MNKLEPFSFTLSILQLYLMEELLGVSHTWKSTGMGHCSWIGEGVIVQKKYRLENCVFKELGEVADDVYLIEGILNTKNPPCEVSEHNKHIPCGLEMNFVDGKQVSHGVVPILSVLL